MCQEVHGKWREGPADGGMFAGFSTVDDRMAEFRMTYMDHYMEKIDNFAWFAASRSVKMLQCDVSNPWQEKISAGRPDQRLRLAYAKTIGRGAPIHGPQFVCFLPPDF